MTYSFYVLNQESDNNGIHLKKMDFEATDLFDAYRKYNCGDCIDCMDWTEDDPTSDMSEATKWMHDQLDDGLGGLVYNVESIQSITNADGSHDWSTTVLAIYACDHLIWSVTKPFNKPALDRLHETEKKLDDLIAEHCGLCMEVSPNSCALKGLFSDDFDRAAYHNIHRRCMCGTFYESFHSCRVCDNIRNGDCDGPNVHCEDTDCPHKNLVKCPVEWPECNYL